MKSAECILEEGFKQRVNTGYFNEQGMFQFTKGRSKNFDPDALSFNTLKWENTVHTMRSSASGIRKFIQVNYDDETIEEMRPDCFISKLRKSDPDQPTFTSKSKVLILQDIFLVYAIFVLIGLLNLGHNNDVSLKKIFSS